MGDPLDLFGAVLFLSSDSSSYITGADIPVDGGVWQKEFNMTYKNNKKSFDKSSNLISGLISFEKEIEIFARNF